MARNPDPITVTLTREEAEALCRMVQGHDDEPLRYDAELRLRAALDSEARPTITEEMVEAGAKAIWRSQPNGSTWATAKRFYESDAKLTRTAARACLEAALGENE